MAPSSRLHRLSPKQALLRPKLTIRTTLRVSIARNSSPNGRKTTTRILFIGTSAHRYAVGSRPVWAESRHGSIRGVCYLCCHNRFSSMFILDLCFVTKHVCRTTNPWKRPDSKRSLWERAGFTTRQGITALTRNQYDILYL